MHLRVIFIMLYRTWSDAVHSAHFAQHFRGRCELLRVSMHIIAWFQSHLHGYKGMNGIAWFQGHLGVSVGF